MNSGLPSLLDAIFGKQELTSVSLDEIHEVIREFPSFNAGHFLLAKKLKLQDDPGYETETKRTALYFNNPFWLQSLLDDGNHFQTAESSFHVKEGQSEDQFDFEEYPDETPNVVQDDKNYTFESYTPFEQPVVKIEESVEEAADKEDELDLETEEILDEKQVSDPVHSEETFQYAEPGSQLVTSFDELMAKYNIQPLDLVDESAEVPGVSLHPEESQPAEASLHPEPSLPIEASLPPEEVLPPEHNVQSEPEPVQDFKLPSAETNAGDTTPADSDPYETVEEVVNEYGVFEEKVVKKGDHDHEMDAFDEPLDQIPFVSERIVEEATPAVHSEKTIDLADALHINSDEDTVNTADQFNAENSGIAESATIVEDQKPEDAPYQTDVHDYDAFDRPPEEPVQTEESVNEQKISDELIDYDPDNTGEPVEYSDDSEQGTNGKMQGLSERFEEHQKILSAFNAKNADSIVFTPYHMVDYFASQGIKLVLEDNPPDQFGKQLKSFTDWLKVMKKLPPRSSSEKEDEKENEQIRHIAAHSIEERDILTESMAEVLAKQGMYENAIALFQKLSLIYPPKSAYFASRIEQLKASLP